MEYKTLTSLLMQESPCIVCKPIKRTFCIVSCRDYENYSNIQKSIIEELKEYSFKRR